MKEYQKHIVSTQNYQVWLHRTSKELVDKIMKEGFYFDQDLSATATAQQRDLKTAEGIYKVGQDFGEAVIVIKIPEVFVKRHYLVTHGDGLKGPKHEGYLGDRDVTYWSDKEKGFMIQRKHVHGWIDREKNDYHENPYRDKPQKLTDKHFPPMFYGGLEKDLIEPEKLPTNKTLKKRKQKKRAELPPPPSEISIHL